MKIYGRYAYQWGIFWSFISAFLWSTTFIGSRYLLSAEKISGQKVTGIILCLAGSMLVINLITSNGIYFDLSHMTRAK